jgi:hypothetical protein
MTSNFSKTDKTLESGNDIDMALTNSEGRQSPRQTFIYSAEASVPELSVVIETIRCFLELLVAEDVRLQTLDAAGLCVAAPGVRCPVRTTVLEQLRG